MNNDNDKKKKGTVLVALIIALVVTLMIHLRMYADMRTFFSGWGYNVFLVAVFFATFAFMFLLGSGMLKIKNEHDTEEEKKNRHTFRVEAIFLIIDLVMAGLFVRVNRQQLASVGTATAIIEVIVFFAIVWAIFELFNRFKLFPQRILVFFLNFFVYVCIPMLFMWIILLGAYQAKYNYQDTLSPSIVNESAKEFGDAMQVAFTKVVLSLYDIGQSNPGLWIWLPIAAFIIATIFLLFDTFTVKDDDEHKSAQQIIDEAIKQKAEEEQLESDYASGKKKKPLLYNFFYKLNESMKGKARREREAKEKEEEKHIHGEIYEIKFIKMKGGTEK